MKKFYIIEIKIDGTVSGHVGPFDAECVADMYCDTYLVPNMPAATFQIIELTNPGWLVDVMQDAYGKQNLTTMLIGNRNEYAKS